MTITQPSLFGLQHSNRDFAKPENWGKNIFNNAFPLALVAYMALQEIPLAYLKLNTEAGIQHDYLPVASIYGTAYDDPRLFYAFERDFSPYQPLVYGQLPRNDVVIYHDVNPYCALEIKLTALPDNATAHLSEADYGCELVIRPDTMVYLALSIMQLFHKDHRQLCPYLASFEAIDDWSEPMMVIPHLPQLRVSLEALMQDYLDDQLPFILHPVWKTEGKSLVLHRQALDAFVWSNFAFTRLFLRDSTLGERISRGTRSLIWLARLLFDFAQQGKVDYEWVIDQLSYNTKNDKAFAVNGQVTHRWMQSPELRSPRIPREAIREIILGGGQQF